LGNRGCPRIESSKAITESVAIKSERALNSSGRGGNWERRRDSTTQFREGGEKAKSKGVAVLVSFALQQSAGGQGFTAASSGGGQISSKGSSGLGVG
jgi:hypothetical protein